MVSRLWVVLGAAVLLAPVQMVAASGGDCSTAVGGLARTVCASPELSKSSADLAGVYAAALEGLSPGAAETVKQGQAAWTEMAAGACTADGEPVDAAYDVAGQTCLQAVFERRIETLSQDSAIGDLRFFSRDGFSLAPDPEGNSFSPVATKTLSVPLIDAPDSAAAAFNGFVEHGSAEFAALVATGATGPDYDVTIDEWLALKVVAVTPERITLERSDYTYGHGAQDSVTEVSYQHFLRKPGRGIVATDVFGSEGWQQKLANLTLVALKQALGDKYFDNGSAVFDTAGSPAHWTFEKDGLAIHFLPFEVANFAEDTPTVVIAWAALDGMLADDAPR